MTHDVSPMIKYIAVIFVYGAMTYSILSNPDVFNAVEVIVVILFGVILLGVDIVDTLNRLKLNREQKIKELKRNKYNY